MTRRIAALLTLLLPSLCLAATRQAGYAEHVVSISVTFQEYDEVKPWAKLNPGERHASGVVVPGPYLLTSAQMIERATLIRVKKHGKSKDYVARVAHADSNVNLALLAVEDPDFFEDLKPVKVAGSRDPADKTFRSVRWRNGQLEMSTTRVSRVEVRKSRACSDIEHAFILVKNDLTGGGWSEPVFDEAELVGLTVSQDGDMAAVLPSDIISAYCTMATGPAPYAGFGSLGARWEPAHDSALASYLGLVGDPRGVLISSVPLGSSAQGVLEPRDLLLELDGHEIDSKGFYEHPRYGRLEFTNITVDGHRAGDEISAKIIRKGLVEELNLTVVNYDNELRLVPSLRPSNAPLFAVEGGFVFRELDEAYLRSWGQEWRNRADSRLMAYWALEGEAQTEERRRIIILAFVLPAPHSIGYYDLGNLAVKTVNNRPIYSVKDLVEAFQEPEAGFHVVEFYPNRVRSSAVLDAAAHEQATAKIMETYSIPLRNRLAAGPPAQPANK